MQSNRSDVFANFLTATMPGGIERQEAEEQEKLVASQQIPKEIRGATREQLAAIGFVFGADVDELFVECKLPPGWTKRATSHAMHSDLLDEKGRKRAKIFYKGAFYDRRADMSMSIRYTVSSYETGSNAEHNRVVVMDSDTVVFEAGEWKLRDFASCDRLEAACKAWRDERYPNWKDPFAYWND